MPELPEVETIRRALDPLLTGRRVADAEVLWPRTIVGGDLPAFVDMVTGASIVSVSRRAKLVVLDLDLGDSVTIHLRMTGELRFHHTRESRPEADTYLRVRLRFEDGSRLDFTDVRKFGRIAYLTAEEFTRVSSDLGIEPLEPEFTPGALATILGNRQRLVKPLLLDQTVIAGLGNIYVDEALFLAGIHPESRSSDVPSAQITSLHSAIVSVLSDAIEHRGTTLRNYRAGLGDEGENRQRLLVYGSRDGTPCTVCGVPLRRIVVGQRGTVYCPSCQTSVQDCVSDESTMRPLS